MTTQGILVDYEWCSGCRSCEVACQMEHGLTVGRSGVVVSEIGPWQREGDVWQHSYIPNFTDDCTLCASRVKNGKLPTCVHHCQARVLTFGALDELAKELMEKPRRFLVRPH